MIERPATGGISIEDSVIDVIDDPLFLHGVLAVWVVHLRRYLEDPEWPLHDAEGRSVAQAYLARMGRALARLTELVDSPPDDLRFHAENVRALREADELIARRHELAWRREISGPAARPAVESRTPPPLSPPQAGGEERTTA